MKLNARRISLSGRMRRAVFYCVDPAGPESREGLFRLGGCYSISDTGTGTASGSMGQV